MSRKNGRTVVRAQSSKGRDGSNTGGNREYVAGMQGLRRSSAASPHRNRTRYSRTSKYRTNYSEAD